MVAEVGGRGPWHQRLHGYRWLRRWREEDSAGLVERSSAPYRIPRHTPGDRVQLIGKIRKLYMTAAEIAEVLGDGALDCLGDSEAHRAGEALVA